MYIQKFSGTFIKERKRNYELEKALKKAQKKIQSS